ncbi:hypothetical protein N7462_005258 [Penicillium macrosclerotiorum]|uniref:uncharacterized protein n=1 Tax=Penicillium macrosclerotiorum TaxID=303699 RepID=UPI0025472BA2|nr:uncharacterized protein N7462_005258 [Penicillium macrosclerotiorum]KAJ5690866.1 hypothetical protein N7462_005258 [Penicillium macrosclerotiorum]
MPGTLPSEDHVDVLIVGAGPAGLMLTNWLSRSDADGLQYRTLEILDSFDLAQKAWCESNHVIEICLWNPESG